MFKKRKEKKRGRHVFYILVLCAYRSGYEYVWFWTVLMTTWSRAQEKCTVMCVLFHRKPFVLFFVFVCLFSKALKFRMCAAIKYCSVLVNSVSVALRSDVTVHRIVESFTFCSLWHPGDEVQNRAVVLFAAVQLTVFGLFSQEVEIVSLGGRKLQRYVPYTYLPVSKERSLPIFHCELWKDKILNNKVSCETWNKRKWQTFI